MPYDYSQLFKTEDGLSNSWEQLYDDNLSYPANILSLLKRVVYLPHDFYDIIAAYAILPSALSRLVPYLFLYGQSGSGKSTVAKFICAVHGIKTSSSTDTFAAMRNIIDGRRYGWTEVEDAESVAGAYNKRVEVNTHMVWEDIDGRVLINNPDLYRLYKISYDRNTDQISISGKEPGTLIQFNTFCPKTFSSISPLHLDDRFRELKRRLLVIPFARVEELSQERKRELGVQDETYAMNLINVDAYNWRGFNDKLDEFWDMDMGAVFIATRTALNKSSLGLTSQQRGISLDLLTTGIASGIWSDEVEAVKKLKEYWSWFKSETEQHSGLGQLLKEYLKQETLNAEAAGLLPAVSVQTMRYQLNTWYEQGWLLDKPSTSSIKELMLDLGWKINKGIWSKK